MVSSHGPAASKTWTWPAMLTRLTHKIRLALDTSEGLTLGGTPPRSNFRNIRVFPPASKNGSAPNLTSGNRLLTCASALTGSSWAKPATAITSASAILPFMTD